MASCAYCNKEFSIASMGLGSVKQHENGKLHKKNSPAGDQLHLTTDARIVENKTEASMSVFDQALQAEVRNALHMAQYNISFSSAESDGDRFRLMFPGHVAAENYHCGRSKVAYLLRFGIA